MAAKRLLAVFIAIIMVLSLAPAGVFTAFADGENILSVGCNKVCAPTPLDDGVDYNNYFFTPPETGDYWICSVAAGDPCCEIYGGEDFFEFDDVSSENSLLNFREKITLTADVTYTISVAQYGDTTSSPLEFDLFITTEDGFSITCEDDGNGCIFAPLFADENTPVSFLPVSFNYSMTAQDIKVTYTDPDLGVTEIDYELSGGVYSFTMPAADVTVSCEFAIPDLDDAIALSLGENSLSVPGGQIGLYSFTAEDTGTYEFVSHSTGCDPLATLYDSTMNELASDDDSYDRDFRIVRSLAAGETVYLSVSVYNNLSMDGTLTVAAVEPVSFDCHGLVLTGEIGVVFYTEIFDPVDFDDAYVEFLIGKSGKQITPLDEVEYNDRYDAYALTCYVGSYRMADKITPVIHWYDDEGVEQTIEFEPYSANDYIDYALDCPDDFTTEEFAIVEALADLGTYSQEYLSGLHGYTTGDGENDKYAQFAVNRVVDAYDYNSILSEAGSFSEYSMDFSTDKIEKTAFSLNLESSTALYIYLTVKDGVSLGSAILMIDDENTEEIEMTQISEKVYRIAIRDIKASELGDVYRIKVTDSEGESIGTCYLTPLTYVARVLELYGNDISKAPLCNTACAVYRYYDAVKFLIETQEDPEPEPYEPDDPDEPVEP